MRIIDCDNSAIDMVAPLCGHALEAVFLTRQSNQSKVDLTYTDSTITFPDPLPRHGVWTLNIKTTCGCFQAPVYINCAAPHMAGKHEGNPDAGKPIVVCCDDPNDPCPDCTDCAECPECAKCLDCPDCDDGTLPAYCPPVGACPPDDPCPDCTDCAECPECAKCLDCPDCDDGTLPGYCPDVPGCEREFQTGPMGRNRPLGLGVISPGESFQYLLPVDDKASVTTVTLTPEPGVTLTTTTSSPSFSANYGAGTSDGDKIGTLHFHTSIPHRFGVVLASSSEMSQAFNPAPDILSPLASSGSVPGTYRLDGYMGFVMPEGQDFDVTLYRGASSHAGIYFYTWPVREAPHAPGDMTCLGQARRQPMPVSFDVDVLNKSIDLDGVKSLTRIRSSGPIYALSVDGIDEFRVDVSALNPMDPLGRIQVVTDIPHKVALRIGGNFYAKFDPAPVQTPASATAGVNPGEWVVASPGSSLTDLDEPFVFPETNLVTVDLFNQGDGDVIITTVNRGACSKPLPSRLCPDGTPVPKGWIIGDNPAHVDLQVKGHLEAVTVEMKAEAAAGYSVSSLNYVDKVFTFAPDTASYDGEHMGTVTLNLSHKVTLPVAVYGEFSAGFEVVFTPAPDRVPSNVGPGQVANSYYVDPSDPMNYGPWVFPEADKIVAQIYARGTGHQVALQFFDLAECLTGLCPAEPADFVTYFRQSPTGASVMRSLGNRLDETRFTVEDKHGIGTVTLEPWGPDISLYNQLTGLKNVSKVTASTATVQKMGMRFALDSTSDSPVEVIFSPAPTRVPAGTPSGTFLGSYKIDNLFMSADQFEFPETDRLQMDFFTTSSGEPYQLSVLRTAFSDLRSCTPALPAQFNGECVEPSLREEGLVSMKQEEAFNLKIGGDVSPSMAGVTYGWVIAGVYNAFPPPAKVNGDLITTYRVASTIAHKMALDLSMAAGEMDVEFDPAPTYAPISPLAGKYHFDGAEPHSSPFRFPITDTVEVKIYKADPALEFVAYYFDIEDC